MLIIMHNEHDDVTLLRGGSHPSRAVCSFSVELSLLAARPPECPLLLSDFMQQFVGINYHIFLLNSSSTETSYTSFYKIMHSSIKIFDLIMFASFWLTCKNNWPLFSGFWKPFCCFRFSFNSAGHLHHLASSLSDPNLVHLANTKLPDLLLASKEKSTTSSYLSAWRRWENWAASKPDIVTYPVDPFHLSLYISHLATTGKKSVADSAIAAIKWAHNAGGLPSPTDNPMVKMALQGHKRLTAAPTTRKQPITPQILAQLVSSHGHKNATLFDLRTLFVILTSYAGFLRFDDISSVRRKDCTFTSDRLTIHLEKSKTDQYRQGSEVTIARTYGPMCPVAVAERYFSALGDPPNSLMPVLRRLSKSKQGFVPTSHPLSYSRTREIVLDALKPHVPDISVYGLHSMRSGGASAASNSLVSDFLISRHGRWKSDKARNMYIQPDSASKLLPSLSLGL